MGTRCRIKNPILPKYAIFPLLACVTVNFMAYNGTEVLTRSWKHYDLTLPFDGMVPVIPWFVVIYLGCYLFWIANYILIARQGKEHCYRFVTADMMSRIVCAVIFLLLPTTNVRPELAGDGLWVMLLRMIYEIDRPTRLFPSFHCLVSWFCYIGIRGQKNVPKAYRMFSCLFAILICVSTQVTKQHYIVDAVGGILVAEGTYWIAFHTELYRTPKNLFDRLYRLCFERRRRPVEKRGNCGEQE
ncbi:phosphatase PAP2 family protein [[Clostridium] hylemonae]|uniref:Inositolphosphotransferase Aur1/Ipt1 domain-containing protein n=1 Tax=[Clostridium] hylemonae DSM 15053 TaxID=553973 RepID=C0C4P2_9FIRM|nr:phosphatase PAP2 family protein [[Clostridium] hylemonae]EEG73035.1 hypothetical protein CLOHYLEM_07058 [[Clostridium] hylemonae DSM 15053]QEK16220.1 hypothetical protein LAJLEIBI_00200 [[Clostridium] hylemonae DSM 15053]